MTEKQLIYIIENIKYMILETEATDEEMLIFLKKQLNFTEKLL